MFCLPPQVSSYAVGLSDEAKSLIRLLLEKDPAKRPTAAEALQHPWLVQSFEASDNPLKAEVFSSLRNLHTMGKFKRKAMQLLAARVSQDDFPKLRATFELLDVDGSGSFRVNNLENLLTTSGIHVTADELASMIDILDMDHNGTINYVEFLAGMICKQASQYQEEMYQVFCSMDSDGNGLLDLSEIAVIIGEADSKEARAALAKVDLSGDGKIDFRCVTVAEGWGGRCGGGRG